jgi:hypothetical protein
MATVPHVSNEDEARDGLARSMAWSSRSQAGTPASTSEVKRSPTAYLSRYPNLNMRHLLL